MVKADTKEEKKSLNKPELLKKVQKVEEPILLLEKPRQITPGSISNLRKPTPNPIQNFSKVKQIFETYCDTPV